MTDRRKKEELTTKDLIMVSITKLGSPTAEYSFPKDSSVEEMLDILGLDTNTEVRNGGSILEANDIIEDGDQLLIMSAGKIEGGGDDEEDDDEEDKEDEDKDEDEEDEEVGEDEEKKEEDEEV